MIVCELGLGRGRAATRAFRPLLGQERVLAGDEALFGVVGVGDLEQVLFVEQAELDGALSGQGLDLGSTQCSDEAELGGDDIVPEAGLGEHPPVADDTDVRDAEALTQLFHLGGHCLWVAGIALEHLDGDRDAIFGREQPVDDLQPPGHAVFGVPDRPEGQVLPSKAAEETS